MRGVSESLAGRAAVLSLPALSSEETDRVSVQRRRGVCAGRLGREWDVILREPVP